jgi:hypothetical protein
VDTNGLVQYYQNLLINQYNPLPKASATIGATVTPMILPTTTTNDIVFNIAPDAGTFVISWNGTNTPPINWNDSATTIQGYIQGISGLGSATVSGSIASRLLTVTFTGVQPPAATLVLVSNSLTLSLAPITVTIAETDVTMPVVVQDAFNVTAPEAVGVQLDVIGKYVGVSRTGAGFTAPITLDDANFATLIQMGIIENNAGSSMGDIVGLLWQFFPNEILVFDGLNMTMDYIIAFTIGPQELVQLFVTEKLLPRPMAVRLRLVIYVPTFTLFGFRTYGAPGFNVFPFNDYTNYHTDWPWLSYADAFVV